LGHPIKHLIWRNFCRLPSLSGLLLLACYVLCVCYGLFYVDFHVLIFNYVLAALWVVKGWCWWTWSWYD